MDGFYVTAIDGRKVAALAGPFRSLAPALALVDTAKAKALEVAPTGAAWACFGTARSQAATHRPGRLNEHLSLILDDEGFVLPTDLEARLVARGYDLDELDRDAAHAMGLSQ